MYFNLSDKTRKYIKKQKETNSINYYINIVDFSKKYTEFLTWRCCIMGIIFAPVIVKQ